MRGKPRPIWHACILCLIAWENTPSQSSPAQACGKEPHCWGRFATCRKYVAIRNGESGQRSPVAWIQPLEATAQYCTLPSTASTTSERVGHDELLHSDFSEPGRRLCSNQGARNSEMNANDPNKHGDPISMSRLKRMQTLPRTHQYLVLRGGESQGNDVNPQASNTSLAKNEFNISIYEVCAIAYKHNDISFFLHAAHVEKHIEDSRFGVARVGDICL
jgi:hypothetical protein